MLINYSVNRHSASSVFKQWISQVICNKSQSIERTFISDSLSRTSALSQYEETAS